MTTLTRTTTIGSGGRFATLADAETHYAQFNMRLVSHDNGCATFAASVIETSTETFDERTWHDMYVANYRLDGKIAPNVPASKRGGEAKPRTRATHCKHAGCKLLREANSAHVLCAFHRKQHDAARSRARNAKNKKVKVTA